MICGEMSEFVKELARGMRREGIINDAATAEKWENFLSNCRNRCEISYRIGATVAVLGDVFVFSAYFIDLYSLGNHINMFIRMASFVIGIICLAYGIATAISSFGLHLEIKGHNAKRFPPGDVFI
jgi:hypothetical protein